MVAGDPHGDERDETTRKALKRQNERAYYSANRERIIAQVKARVAMNPEARRVYRKSYYEANRSAAIRDAAKWNQANANLVNARARERNRIDPKPAQQRREKWEKAHPQQYRESAAKRKNRRHRERMATDPSYRALISCRGRIKQAMRFWKAGKKSATTHKLIGCTMAQLAAHLESLFTDGMTWGNHGRMGWHIDHIRPCASYDLTDPQEQAKCFHYTNLQPLWWHENVRKADRVL